MRKQHINEIIQITAGSFILAVSVSFFILPFNIVSGGVAGISVALEHIIHIESATIINILTPFLFLIGGLCLGKKFVFNSLLSTSLYLVFTNLLNQVSLDFTLDPIIASLYSGILAGIGLGMVMRTGSSTGGMDIPPLIIHKYTNIKVSTLVMITDTLTVLLGVLSYGIEAVLIGIISVYSCSLTIDKVLTFGSEKAKSVYIICNQVEKVNQAIHERIDRGTTILSAIGGYTGNQREIILVVLTSSQYPELTRIINEIDPDAFLIVQDANEVHGQGFSYTHKI